MPRHKKKDQKAIAKRKRNRKKGETAFVVSPRRLLLADLRAAVKSLRSVHAVPYKLFIPLPGSQNPSEQKANQK